MLKKHRKVNWNLKNSKTKVKLKKSFFLREIFWFEKKFFFEIAKFLPNSFKDLTFSLGKSKITKSVIEVKSKIVHNFTKNKYFLMKFSEVVKLVGSATSQSLSTNGQVWTTFRTGLDFKFQLFHQISALDIPEYWRGIGSSSPIFARSHAKWGYGTGFIVSNR